jgi:hypothetical protein
MDINSINGVLRAIVPAVLAYAVGKGWVGAGAVADITAAVLAVAAAVWSLKSNKPSA